MADTPSTRFVSKADMLAIAAQMKAKYTNQNAIASIKVGADTFAAAEAQDAFELEAGSNVELALTGDKVTVSATDTTYSDVVADGDSGLMTGADKAKLDGIAAGAEVNQNAIAGIKVGATTITAGTKSDQVEIEAGSNVTVTAAGKKVTIAAADATTYTLEQDVTDGHKIIFTPSVGQATEITIPDDDTTYDPATASADGLMSSADFTKLAGIEAGAQVNDLETVKVNGTALTATDKAVDILIAEGSVNGAISVAGSSVSVHGLAAGAYTGIAASITNGETGLVTGDLVHDYVAAQVSAAYKPGGAIAPAGVTSALLVAANEGKVYNLTSDLTLDATTAALFEDGATGEIIKEGTNIAVVEDGGSYKFDALAGFIDLSGYVKASDLGGLTQAEIDEIIAAL